MIGTGYTGFAAKARRNSARLEVNADGVGAGLPAMGCAAAPAISKKTQLSYHQRSQKEQTRFPTETFLFTHLAPLRFISNFRYFY